MYPIKCELVSPDRISELCPLLRTDDLVGGLWVPGDGVGNPYEICRALAALSAEMGVKVIQVIFRNMSGHASQLQSTLGFATLDKAAALGLATATPLTDLRQYINSNLGFSNLKI